MAYKKWLIAEADKDLASDLSEKLNIDPFIAYLLVSRGISDELTASQFVSQSSTFTSPYSLYEMDKAVSRINDAIENGEKICIFGDYDCDGVTSTALLVTFFESMGVDVTYFIPDRLTDGYGMNKTAIDNIHNNGTDLIITVDNGISALEEAEYVYSLGMELIVTDHHRIGNSLPRACAVINPHRVENDIEFRDYAGVGVAFKLACAVYGGDISDLIEQYADLVAIGTIGDVMPLVSENRTLVRVGLDLINNNSRIGIAALRKVAGNFDKIITSTDVAFQLCPRINAAGRMDTADIAMKLLISDDYDEASFKASQLNIENEHRHEVEEEIFNNINQQITENPNLVRTSVIVIAGNNYHHGVIGIVAARLVSKYGKPTVVISIDDDGNCVGSARSIEGFNIYDAFASCSSFLTHFGGHPLAAGLGLTEENISSFRDNINLYANQKYETMPVQSIKLDCKLSPYYLTTDLVDNLAVLEPFGSGNPQPIFGLFNVDLLAVTPIGDGSHIRLDVQKKSKKFKIVFFRIKESEFPYKPGEKLDFVVKVSKNFYKGKFYLSVKGEDFRKSKIDEQKYFCEYKDYEKFMLGSDLDYDIMPSREQFAVAYRYIKNNSDKHFSAEDLYFSLSQSINFTMLMFIIDTFEECGILSADGERYIINKTDRKFDLNNTDVIKNLKGRLAIE